MVMILKHLRMCILVIVALATTTLKAQGASRQEVLDVEITISLKDVTLKQALQEIELVAKIKFVYSRSYLNLDDKVTIDVAGKKLGQLLEELLTPRSIKFAVHDSENFVVLTQAKMRSVIPIDEERTPVAIPAYAARISGKVTDVAGGSMAGVNVVEKGTTNGTSSDATGVYSLEVTDNAILIFSFIGFKSVEVSITGRTVIDVTMEEDQSVLDAVLVNAGYWKVNEREQTGSISRVTAEEIQRQPVGNPMAALIGRMPGVNVSQSSGMPGAPFTIQIRGRNSLRTDGNRPLYVVDGVPFPSNSVGVGYSVLANPSPLNSINPADIESIEILKDADATAIYGTRGANGVVLITTKKGGPGKTKLDLNFYTGIGKVGHFMDLLNTEQYLTMRREAHKNDGTPIAFSEYDLTEWDTTRYTDWQKVLIGGTSRVTSAQLSFSGGGENTHFQFGTGYYSEGSVFLGDFGDKKLSTHFSLSHQSPDKRFSILVQNSFVIDNNKLPLADLTARALMLPPVAPALYTEDGSINWQNGTWPMYSNPLIFDLLDYTINSENLISNVNLGYEIFRGLRVKANVGYNLLHSKDLNLAPIAANDPILGITTGYSDHTTGLTSTWIVEPQVEYVREIGRGTLTVLAGTTIQQTTRSAESIRADGYANDALLENLASAAQLFVLTSDFTDYRYNAVFGRVNYNLGGKYFFNVTGRRDGSSRFGPTKTFANFGAIGAAWIFSEQFFKNSSLLSFGKIRTSFGVTGNDQIADYGYLDSYSATVYPYQGKSGLVPTRLANPDYGWEKTLKAEAAMELGFFKDRLGLTAAYYRNESSNQLTGYNLPRITGFSSIQYNLPATLRNTGFELSIRSSNVQRGDITWTTSLNLTIPRNKLVSYPGIETSPNANQWEVGKPLTTSKKFHYVGVDTQTGLYQFEDLNGNGTGTDSPGDLVATGFVGQKYFGSITNSIQYRGLELNFMFQYVNQAGRKYSTVTTTFSTPGQMTNQPVQVLERWQQPGDDAAIQKFTMSSAASNAYLASSLSDNLVDNSSFVRLKNVSLSYGIPERFTKSWKVQSTRIFLQGQNLITFTDYIGMDPEPTIPNGLPPLRVLTAGVQVSI
ncbi:MAG TPA: SusC/RagA family TonB-linked outer membrane protein [Cyclobacteriaceae bacterium]|nr:SusC/RagA family TonB-linked outer membrane protein [Cyclobacteriaceae bacterium]